ncbi:LisH domain-containing protein [Aphelenchoides besseyi]|nr:LisH domain-containing protein [Aphelenchoides besseyi]
MHVGGGNSHLAPNTTRSVADRIKGITLSEGLTANSHDNSLQLDGLLYHDAISRDNDHNSNDDYRPSTSQFESGDRRHTRHKLTTASNLVASKRNPVTPSHLLDERQRNTVRIIGQYLTSLGLKSTAEQLVEETGCRIENSLAVRLRNFVRQQAWQRAIEVLDNMRDVLGPENYYRTRVLLVEERIKDKLSKKDTLSVLKLLRNEYPTGNEFRERREYLTTLIFRDPNETALMFKNRDKEKIVDETLKYLYKLMPSTVLLAPNRLERLIGHAWKYQLEKCDLHVNEVDLKVQSSEFVLKDHSCATDFPSRCSQILEEHKTEVWCVKFSPCGHYLATGAKDSKVYVWRLDDTKGLRVSKFRRLRLPHHISGIAVLSWSYDSRFLAVAASERISCGVFLFNVIAGAMTKEIRPSQTENFCAVSFFGDNSHRLSCADHLGNFQYHDADNPQQQPKCFHGFRIRCMYSMKDGYTVIASDTLNRIRSYNFSTQEEMTLIQETAAITYFSVDRNEEHCLITTKTEGLRLWSLATRTLMRTFFGSVHNDFVISSTFGGASGDFIASGSEDDQVIIWNRRSDKPICRLQGHTGSVNSVSWNPVFHGMLASGSDDGKVRIWVSKTGDSSKS